MEFNIVCSNGTPNQELSNIIKLDWDKFVSTYNKGINNPNVEEVRQACVEVDQLYGSLRRNFGRAIFMNSQNEDEARACMYSAEFCLTYLFKHYRELCDDA